MIGRLLALFMLIVLCPLILVISLLILTNDGLPILFKQKRVGKDYSYFTILKFRTMINETPNVATHLLKNQDLYLTKLGKTLRKYSLDEIPNLYNIIKGEMSFVGPRPALYNYDHLIELRKKNNIGKLLPGLTGWAQINGRDDISLKEKVAFEKEYMLRKSMKFDLEIFFKTFYVAFLKK